MLFESITHIKRACSDITFSFFIIKRHIIGVGMGCLAFIRFSKSLTKIKNSLYKRNLIAFPRVVSVFNN